MIQKNCLYKVLDKDGTCWGTVTLKWDGVSPLGSHDYSGYLDASDEYEKVSRLFEKHDVLMSMSDADEEESKKSSLAIANLGVRLKLGAESKPIDVLVFVAKTKNGLLFTCSENIEE